MKMPEVGDQVTFKFKNHSAVLTGPLAHTQSDTYTLTGTIVQKPSWAKGDVLALRVPGTPVGLRIIDVNEIIGWPAKKKSSDVKRFEIEGSKGSKYIVYHANNSWSCSCPGFEFRRYCKHIDTAKAK